MEKLNKLEVEGHFLSLGKLPAADPQLKSSLWCNMGTVSRMVLEAPAEHSGKRRNEKHPRLGSKLVSPKVSGRER